MAVEQMQKISICALQKYRKPILERLQELGWMEIHLDAGEVQGFQTMDTAGARNAFQKRMHLADQALEILERYAPAKQSIFHSLEGKKLLEGSLYDRVAAHRSEYSGTANTLISLEQEIQARKTRIQKTQLRIDEMQPWMKLDVAMTRPGTRRCDFFVGTLPAPYSEEEIREFVEEESPGLSLYSVQVLSASRDGTCLAVVAVKEQAEKLEEVLRSRGFARPSQLLNRPPEEKKKQLEQRIRTAQEEISQLEQQIREMSGEREHLQLMSDYYRVRADKYEVLGHLPQTRSVFALEGYIPGRAAGKLQEELTKTYGAVVETAEIPQDEEAPVLLRNGTFAGSGEGVLASFGLPGKGEIDPTCIMTVFYVFLFGLMLSDAAYGAIVSIACGAAILKFPRMEENLKKSLRLFFWCGLSTLFWGIMFGGYFGDAADVIAKTFLGVPLAEGQSVIPALWFVPLNDPMRLLMYSLLFGCIHLFTGLGIKGYLCLKHKDYMAFVCDVVFWFLLILGLLLMLIPSSMFASMFGIDVTFPAFFTVLSKLMAIAGALGILLFAGRRKKNKWGIRLALGAYDLYNITGWLSDLLSYSRLLALGLATGVIASVVNQMGSMLGRSIPGVILFVIVFVAGHTFNLAINLLGAYVHTCRLQYVEFFGKFYEGGGKEFTPFVSDTKYVEIKGGKQE